MADKPTIDSVTTFVAEIEVESLDKVLSKFQGRRTARTLAAARRIRAKKVKVKIPRNLLRQLWRIIGGWQENGLKSGWGSNTPDDKWMVVQVGELEFIAPKGDSSWTTGVLRYRGMKVAHIHNSWLDNAKRSGAMQSLGVQYQP